MHDPIGFVAVRRSTFVEHKSFPHSNPSTAAIDHLFFFFFKTEKNIINEKLDIMGTSREKDERGSAINNLISARSLPKPSSRSSIRSGTRRVLLVLVAEQVTIVLWHRPYFALL